MVQSELSDLGERMAQNRVNLCKMKPIGRCTFWMLFVLAILYPAAKSIS